MSFEFCQQVDLVVEEVPVSYGFVRDYDAQRQKDGEIFYFRLVLPVRWSGGKIGRGMIGYLIFQPIKAAQFML